MSLSRAVSALYWNTCPTCGETAYSPCRSRRTRRVTDTHRARIDARYEPTVEPDDALDRLADEPIAIRLALQAAHDLGWRRGMDDGGWA